MSSAAKNKIIKNADENIEKEGINESGKVKAETFLKNPDENKKIFGFNSGLKIYCLAFAFITLLAIAGNIFGDEASQFFSWYFMIMILGIINMPVTILLTDRFKDCGWIVSKVIGIALTGWLMWFLSSIELFKFSRGACIAVCCFCAVINAVILIFYELKHKEKFRFFTESSEVIHNAFFMEIVFLFIFILWTYIKCFNNGAFGTTEKLMDFGFMQSMFKSDYMPPEDLWLAGEPLNYYYVGQFITTYLSKLSGVGVGYGYNLSLMVIAAFAFSLPLSIISSISADSKLIRENKDKGIYRFFPYLAGTISGIAVTFAGNFHYCMYASIIPKTRVLLGIDKVAEAADYSFSNFWFPNSTRYIGFDPNVADKTIHEFPSYSFVLGDLHAHVINIMFVLTVVAILAGWLMKNRSFCENVQNGGENLKLNRRKKLLGITLTDIFDPAVIAAGFFIGLFHTTNFWDFPIYFVVSGAVILFINCIKYNFGLGSLVLTAIHAVEVLLISTIVCLPFTLNFNMIASEIRLTENTSELYQLAILWGIPVLCVAVFFFRLIGELKEKKVFDMEEKKCGGVMYTFRFIGNLELTDLFVLILGLCAIGLVILPELIYVKDIYSGDYKRSNTMFKLTYQAYILFGMAMGYIIPRFILFSKKFLRGFGIVMLLLLNWTVGYFKNAVNGWFGDVTAGVSFGIRFDDAGVNPIADDMKKYVILFAIHLIVWFWAILAFFYISLSKGKKKSLMIASSTVLTVFFVCAISIAALKYTPNERYKGIDCSQYLQNISIEDYNATNWINENIEGRPVLLEANGNSYDTDYNRISVRTGLPTVMGWKTHEWLWQSNSSTEYPQELRLREEDIEDIYTDTDEEYIRALIEKYNIEYIYVGDAERKKYAELNEPMLLSLGDICYLCDAREDGNVYTYIIKVRR